MGTANPPLNSESRQNYLDNDPALNRPPIDHRRLKATNFSVSHPGNPPTSFKSTYDATLKNHHPEKPPLVKKILDTHFQMGSENGKLHTEQLSNFTPGKHGEPMDKQLYYNLRSSHFKFDESKENPFKSIFN